MNTVKSKFFTFDVMLHDRFVCTLRYPFDRSHSEFIDGKPTRVIELEALEAFVIEHRPSLRGKDFRICW